MQFSAFGFMHADYTISFPSEILRPIGLGRGKLIHCMYYPAKYSSTKDPNGFNSFGFMMTPLPYQDWPRTARFTIKIKDIAGATNALCKVISEEGGSLGLIRGGSTGYTYFTLNVSITFNDLELTINSKYNKKNGYYVDTNTRKLKLIQRIKEECKAFLYSGEVSIDLPNGKKLAKSNYQHSDPVVASMCTSLTYFWRLTQLEDCKEIKSFKLKLGSNNRVIDDKRHIQSIFSKEISKSSERFEVIGSRPIYASVDTKDQTIRFRVLPKENKTSIIGIRIDWETFVGTDSRGLLQAIARHCENNNWNIRQVLSKESSESKQAYGRMNLVVEMKSPAEARRYLDIKPELLREEFQESFLEGHKVRQARVTQLTSMLASAWRRSDVGEEKFRVKFLISAPFRKYDEARKLTKELNELGYFAEFIHDALEKQPGKHPLHLMADIVRKGSALLVIVDENYGKYVWDKSEGSDNKQKKDGLYSEFETAMALGAGIKVYPVAYECGENIPDLPSESLLSPKTSMFMKLDFEKDLERSMLLVEDRYLELVGIIS